MDDTGLRISINRHSPNPANKYTEWRRVGDNKIHREDGPARMYMIGYAPDEWWLHGYYYDTFDSWAADLKLSEVEKARLILEYF